MLHDIVRLTSRAAMPVDRLCQRLVVSEKALRSEIKAARTEGYHIRIVDGFVTAKPLYGALAEVQLGDRKPGRKYVCGVSDIHFGSTHCHEDAVLEHIHRAWDRGARTGVCAGDILDGNKEVLLADQEYIGFDHQARRAVNIFRKAPPIKWAVIDGNHDGYFSASAGAISGRILESRMREAKVDWTFLGMCLGRAVIHGARWQLWHPSGAGSTRNAVRRILNARAEALDEPCDILMIGHYHRFVSLPIFPERVHGIAAGTFQTKASEFANRITNNWDIGGTITSYTLGRKGAITEVSSEFFPAKGLSLNEKI